MAHLPDILAYLDPGVGALILQAAAAGILGALFTIKLWWAKFMGLFRKPAADDLTPSGSPVETLPGSPIEPPPSGTAADIRTDNVAGEDKL